MKKTLAQFSVFIFVIYSCSMTKPQDEFQIGLKHYSNQDYTNAIASFDKVIKSTDTIMEAYLYRGYSFRAISEKEKAKLDFSKLTLSVSDSDLCNGYANRAGVYYDERNYENALLDYKKSLEYCSDKSLIMNMISHMYFATNQKDSGCIYYNKSISINKTEFNPEIPSYCDSINSNQ